MIDLLVSSCNLSASHAPRSRHVAEVKSPDDVHRYGGGGGGDCGRQSMAGGLAEDVSPSWIVTAGAGDDQACLRYFPSFDNEVCPRGLESSWIVGSCQVVMVG